MRLPLPPQEQRGLTIVELMVVMVLTTAFSGMVISFALDYWGNSTSLRNDSETFV
ncbi:prepilin-type N-terminal cleavage/methylation domain-containing protein, partial [Candidatus Saccharibacteria bacterium]|nr:prepilin-type N-terminal cleavage/methylation domain-containing protein [Candidatus Saccharibacteria bacterium]